MKKSVSRKDHDEQQSREQLIEKGRLLHSQAVHQALTTMIVYVKNTVLKVCHLNRSNQDLRYSKSVNQ